MFNNKLSQEVFESKYQYKNETSLEAFQRVAKTLASVEQTQQDYWYNQFLNTLLKFDENNKPIGIKFTLGGRVLANIGTDYKNATLFNCFINGPVKNATINYKRASIKDPNVHYDVTYQTPDTGDDMMNIMLTLLEQAKTLASEGGWGFNCSFIRPRSSMINGTGVKHPGVVSYLEIFDKVSDVIVRGTDDGYRDELYNHLITYEDINQLLETPKKKQIRKGAMMVVLNVDHPDIEEYVKAKQKSSYLQRFNMSVGVTDEFMEKVESDGLFNLKFNGVIYKTVKAKELYDLIMASTYNRNDPGIQFLDNMQKNNPLSYLTELTTTNPCGEIGGDENLTTVCLLGSCNLTQYVNLDRSFDFNQFTIDCRIFTRMLDNVNDLEESVLSPYLWAIKNVRQFGMGVNGLGSTLMMMGMRYGSKESIDFCTRLAKLKLNICLHESAHLAELKGQAPVFDSRYFQTPYWLDFLKDKLYDTTIREVKKHGVRNMKQGTNPPLGHSSVLCNNVSNGIEPVFNFRYDRTYVSHEWPEGLNKDNVKDYLQYKNVSGTDTWQGYYNGSRYYYEPSNRGLCQIETVYDYGYLWIKEHYPEDLEHDEPWLISTQELLVEDHLSIHEVFQQYIDQSVSKTVNIPEDYPFENFKQLYFNAWKKGINGITTYRAGTMESVLSVEDEDEEIIYENIQLPKTFLNGPMRKIEREGIKLYIHFSYLENDIHFTKPIAIWITTNHKYSGEAIYVNRALKELKKLLQTSGVDNLQIIKQEEKIQLNVPHNKIAKMISMCLRHNIPILNIVEALDNLEGDWIGSIITAVRKFLSEHIIDGTKYTNKTCDNCNSTEIIHESGCMKCLQCGSSQCS